MVLGSQNPRFSHFFRCFFDIIFEARFEEAQNRKKTRQERRRQREDSWAAVIPMLLGRTEEGLQDLRNLANRTWRYELGTMNLKTLLLLV